MEANFIFYPARPSSIRPDKLDSSFEDVFFATRDDVRLMVGHPASRSSIDLGLVSWQRPPGNISHRVENIKLLHDKVKINIFIFDYRGYGRAKARL